MTRQSMPPPLTDAEEREWLAQERAWRDERAGITGPADPSLGSYRTVVRALREPVTPALPVDFARTLDAQCRHARAGGGVESGLEVQVQRALLGLLAVSALVALALRGGDWWRASTAVLPLLDHPTTLNWMLALASCLGLSWAMDRLRRRTLPR
ncbi:hypothetical protein [Cognatiluteimonas telluris]|jgi:hypothetical protein|uniref:hypothetical protein n=1 Tax=Cognatiluteimonas telluris TaxID=1104775 RepID=UPI00140BF442|nr:hypothetical protein [Lysobacter telluris]